MEYTPESLREFKIRHDEEKKRGPADEGGFGGFGGFGDSPPAPTAAETKAVCQISFYFSFLKWEIL